MLSPVFQQLYQQAHDMLRRQNAAKVYFQLAPPQGVDPHCYNLPSENEIAAILPGDNEHANAGRDLIVTLHLQNQQDAPRFQHIFGTNFNYTPPIYVLLPGRILLVLQAESDNEIDRKSTR